MERSELLNLGKEGRKSIAIKNDPWRILKYYWAADNKQKTEECVETIIQKLKTVKESEREYRNQYYKQVKEIAPYIITLKLEVEAARINKRILRSFRSMCEILFKEDANRIYEILAIYRALDINENPRMPKTALIKLGEALESKSEEKRKIATQILKDSKEDERQRTLQEIRAELTIEKKNNDKSTYNFTEDESSLLDLSCKLDDMINDINEGCGLWEFEDVPGEQLEREEVDDVKSKTNKRSVVAHIVSSIFENSFELLKYIQDNYKPDGKGSWATVTTPLFLEVTELRSTTEKV